MKTDNDIRLILILAVFAVLAIIATIPVYGMYFSQPDKQSLVCVSVAEGVKLLINHNGIAIAGGF